MKTHYKKLMNPNYLGSWDVDPEVGYLDIKITNVSKELITGVGGEKEECILARLENQKPMILNATNCKTLKKIFNSPFIEDWKGKTARVQVEKVKAFGDVWDALRIKADKNIDTREELTPDNKSWQDAVQALTDGKCTMAYVQKKFRVSEVNVKKLLEESQEAA